MSWKYVIYADSSIYYLSIVIIILIIIDINFKINFFEKYDSIYFLRNQVYV